MLTSKSLNFLFELSGNNDRDWFKSNKSRYETDLKKPFEDFVGALMEAMKASFEPDLVVDPKAAIYRIYRDVRFSKDKRPYKEHVSASISRFGRKNKEMPGYYLHVEPGMLMFGGGAYFLERPNLQKVRERIRQNPAAFQAIVENKGFNETFGDLRGERNKRLPKEFKSVEQEMPYIANKQFYFMNEGPVELALEDNAIEVLAAKLQEGKALNEFLVDAMLGS